MLHLHRHRLQKYYEICVSVCCTLSSFFYVAYRVLFKELDVRLCVW
jgi:hypothetical protein